MYWASHARQSVEDNSVIFAMDAAARVMDPREFLFARFMVA